MTSLQCAVLNARGADEQTGGQGLALRFTHEECVTALVVSLTMMQPAHMVNYHKDKQGPFSNPPVEAPNDLHEIVKLVG